MQSARKRAHLCAMLLPASKKHTSTISVSLVLVFANSPSFPSLRLKRKRIKHEITCKPVDRDDTFLYSVSYLQGPLEKTPASQHRMSRMRLWACSLAMLPSVRWHKASSSFSWKSRNCSIAQRWTLKMNSKSKPGLKLVLHLLNNKRTHFLLQVFYCVLLRIFWATTCTCSTVLNISFFNWYVQLVRKSHYHSFGSEEMCCYDPFIFIW